MTNEERIDLVDGLRKMADFFEAHPEIECPYSVQANVYGASKESLQAFAKAAGRVDKDAVGSTFWLRKKFSQKVQLDFNAQRDEVCEQVQVGTKMVEAQPERIEVHEAVEAHEEPVYEWRCGSILQSSEVAEVEG